MNEIVVRTIDQENGIKKTLKSIRKGLTRYPDAKSSEPIHIFMPKVLDAKSSEPIHIFMPKVLDAKSSEPIHIFMPKVLDAKS